MSFVIATHRTKPVRLHMKNLYPYLLLFWIIIYQWSKPEILKLIKQFDHKEAAGTDGIPVKYIKMVGDIIWPILCMICISHRKKWNFSYVGKNSYCDTNYKAGPHQMATNNRLISVLFPIAKVFGKRIYSTLNSFFIFNSFLIRNKLICKDQVVFLRCHLISSAIMDIYSNIGYLTSLIEKGILVQQARSQVSSFGWAKYSFRGEKQIYIYMFKTIFSRHNKS